MSTIIVNGENVPAVLTGGTLLDFKEATGRDFLKVAQEGDSSDAIALAWCGVKAAARKEGRKYEQTLREFADALSVRELNSLGAWVTEELKDDTAPDSKKKGVTRRG